MARGWERSDEWDHRGRTRKRWLGMAGFGIVVYVLGIATGSLLSTGTRAAAPPPGRAQQSNALSPALNSNIITQVYKNVNSSVVTITAVTPSDSKGGPTEDVGSGFFVDTSGDIATNAHVVNGLKKVLVRVGDHSYPGQVLGSDTIDDLAVVRIAPRPEFVPLALGTAKNLQPGQLVIAIGNPFELTSSVTAGIVSGLNRSMPDANGRTMYGLVQTDAALNPGNSGGPLLDANGRVVGINTAIESPVEGSVGIGFAIPIDRFEQLMPKLLLGQNIDYPWLGISGQDIDPLLQQQAKLPVSQGILVMSVDAHGPASTAGMKGDSGTLDNPKGDGDIITQINGRPVASIADLTQAISQFTPGAMIQVGILRNGKPMTISVTLGNWKDRG